MVCYKAGVLNVSHMAWQVAQGSPVNVKSVLEIASGRPFQAGGPPGGPYGLAGPSEAISGQVAQGSPAKHR